jgi:hypothetical protein
MLLDWNFVKSERLARYHAVDLRVYIAENTSEKTKSIIFI